MLTVQLDNNRRLIRQHSLFTNSTEKKLNLLNKIAFRKNEIREGSKVSSNEPLPLMVELWNFMK